MRCDIADLYAKLYGRKRPVTVPIPELAAMKKQSYLVDSAKKIEKSKQEGYKIPKKSEKSKDSPSLLVQQQPQPTRPGPSTGTQRVTPRGGNFI